MADEIKDEGFGNLIDLHGNELSSDKEDKSEDKEGDKAALSDLASELKLGDKPETDDVKVDEKAAEEPAVVAEENPAMPEESTDSAVTHAPEPVVPHVEVEGIEKPVDDVMKDIEGVGEAVEGAAEAEGPAAFSDIHDAASAIEGIAKIGSLDKLKDAGNLLTEALPAIGSVEKDAKDLGDEAKARFQQLKTKGAEFLASLESIFKRG